MATLRHPLSRSATGEFGVEYNDRNGRITAVYCTDPRGTQARITPGADPPQAISAGQTIPLPAGATITFGPDDEGHASFTITGLSTWAFYRGR